MVKYSRCRTLNVDELDCQTVQVDMSTNDKNLCEIDNNHDGSATASSFKTTKSVADRPVAKPKGLKPVVEWKKMKPKFSSQPINKEKQSVSELVGKLVTFSEVERFGQFF